MIIVKSAADLERMRESGQVAARVRDAVAKCITPGVTTGELADYGIGDAMQKGTPQLWTALIGSGDKTVFIAYQIP